MDFIDYYKILEVDKTASEADIKSIQETGKKVPSGS